MSSKRICSRCENQGEGFSDDFLECRRCQYFRSLHNNNIAHAQFKTCTLCLNPDQTPVSLTTATTNVPNDVVTEYDDMPPLEDIPTTPTGATTTATTTTTTTTTTPTPTTATTSRWWFW